MLNACIQANIQPKDTNLNVIGYSADRDLWMQALASYFAGAQANRLLRLATANYGYEVAVCTTKTRFSVGIGFGGLLGLVYPF